MSAVPMTAENTTTFARPGPAAAPAKTSDTLKGLLGGDVETVTGKIIAVDEADDRIMGKVAEGDVVEGNVIFKQGGRIAGTVLGNVMALDGTLVLDATAVVHGNVSASKRLIVLGLIEQSDASATLEVTCPGLVIVAGEGLVNGSLAYGNLVVYDEGMVNGRMTKFDPQRHSISYTPAPARKAQNVPGPLAGRPVFGASPSASASAAPLAVNA